MQKYKKWAARLRKILESRKPKQRVNRGGDWSLDFGLLWKEDLGASDAATRRIERCLKLAEHHYNQVERPILHDANDFRLRFDWFNNVLEMLEKRNPSCAVTQKLVDIEKEMW